MGPKSGSKTQKDRIARPQPVGTTIQSKCRLVVPRGNGRPCLPPGLAAGRLAQDADLKAGRPPGRAIPRLAGTLIEGVTPHEATVGCPS